MMWKVKGQEKAKTAKQSVPPQKARGPPKKYSPAKMLDLAKCWIDID